MLLIAPRGTAAKASSEDAIATDSVAGLFLLAGGSNATKYQRAAYAMLTTPSTNHERVNWTEPRLGFDAPSIICELRSEIVAPFITTQLGIPVLCDTTKLTNHRKHLARWVRALRKNPSLIYNLTAYASEAVDFLLSLKG